MSGRFRSSTTSRTGSLASAFERLGAGADRDDASSPPARGRPRRARRGSPRPRPAGRCRSTPLAGPQEAEQRSGSSRPSGRGEHRRRASPARAARLAVDRHLRPPPDGDADRAPVELAPRPRRRPHGLHDAEDADLPGTALGGRVVFAASRARRPGRCPCRSRCRSRAPRALTATRREALRQTQRRRWRGGARWPRGGWWRAWSRFDDSTGRLPVVLRMYIGR